MQPLTPGTAALHVTIATPPARGRAGRANPTNYFDVALLRFGDGVGFGDEQPVTGGPQWLAVPTGTTQVGYACLTGAVLTVAEVAGAAAPPANWQKQPWDRNPTPITRGVLGIVTGATTETQEWTYTVPAGRIFAVAKLSVEISVQTSIPTNNYGQMAAYVGSTRICVALITSLNQASFAEDDLHSGPLICPAGTALQGTAYQSVGGWNMIISTSLAGTEFDA